MTPFGRRLRELRAAKGVAQKQMAAALKVTPAYLSALEHGHRGKPATGFVQQICAYFNLAWDDVDELKRLADLSDPKPTIDTGGLSPEATELANRLAAEIGRLEPERLRKLLEALGREGRGGDED